MNKSCLLGMACVSFLLSFNSQLSSADPFTGIGFLHDGVSYSESFGISADGSTVVGRSGTISVDEAFIWIQTGGMVGLGDLPGGNFFSIARDVSADGSAVVGWSQTGGILGGASRGWDEAFRWTQDGGMENLGLLQHPTICSTCAGHSIAEGVSDDGSTVVGKSKVFSDLIAFRWTESDGLTSIGTLGGRESIAYDVSGDGSVIVGQSNPSTDPKVFPEAFRWTQTDGMVGLGYLEGGRGDSVATAASNDGSVIVGNGSSSLHVIEAFRWTETDGMVGLGAPTGGNCYSQANAVSGDGSVVVGNMNCDSWPLVKAFIWDSDNGMQSISDLLTTNNVDLTGRKLLDATGISANGDYIVGNGISPDGLYEAWIANISNVPIPPALWLFGSGLLGLVGIAREKNCA